jgi:hypothetical protein
MVYFLTFFWGWPFSRHAWFAAETDRKATIFGNIWSEPANTGLNCLLFFEYWFVAADER